jgi:hypothetical protein
MNLRITTLIMRGAERHRGVSTQAQLGGPAGSTDHHTRDRLRGLRGETA